MVKITDEVEAKVVGKMVVMVVMMMMTLMILMTDTDPAWWRSQTRWKRRKWVR